MIGLVDPERAPTDSVRASLTAVFLFAAAAPLVAGLGLFVRRGWRRPLPWMLLGCWVAGVGVYFLFHHPAFGQAYFRAARSCRSRCSRLWAGCAPAGR